MTTNMKGLVSCLVLLTLACDASAQFPGANGGGRPPVWIGNSELEGSVGPSTLIVNSGGPLDTSDLPVPQYSGGFSPGYVKPGSFASLLGNEGGPLATPNSSGGSGGPSSLIRNLDNIATLPPPQASSALNGGSRESYSLPGNNENLVTIPNSSDTFNSGSGGSEESSSLPENNGGLVATPTSSDGFTSGSVGPGNNPGLVATNAPLLFSLPLSSTQDSDSGLTSSTRT